MSFFGTAADVLGKLVISLAGRTLGDRIKEAKTQRRMDRLVAEAVDRLIEQIEDYLRAERVSDSRKLVLISSICNKLQPLADDPQQFFAGDLDGPTIFRQCHPRGELPQEVREDGLDQVYTVLFPQVAHFLAGSRVALAEWQAEGYREGFKKLRALAEEISRLSAKVAELPTAVLGAQEDKEREEAETLLRDLAQTVLNNLLVRLDLSPLRAERALYGALGEHFVVPAFLERRKKAEPLDKAETIIANLGSPRDRHVVHGGAGVGKSTWCLWLQERLLQSTPNRLAVAFRLREVTNIEQQSLLDLLRDRAGVHLRDLLTAKVLQSWHSAGRLVVILDGFDEVPEERRDAVEKWIKELAVAAKKTTVLVTSRPLQSGHLEGLAARGKSQVSLETQ